MRWRTAQIHPADQSTLTQRQVAAHFGIDERSYRRYEADRALESARRIPGWLARMVRDGYLIPGYTRRQGA